MADETLARFQLRFQTPEALAAAKLLIDAAVEGGLTIKPRTNAVTALEFDDASGVAPLSIIANNAHALVYLRGPALRKFPGLFDKATSVFGPVSPNQKGEYRWRVQNVEEIGRILDWLHAEAVLPWRGGRRVVPAVRRDGRLPAAVLDKVATSDILAAAGELSDGFADHDYSEATQYEVVVGEHRLKPKALFGVAATRALGFRVIPSHFSGGLGTQAFRKIQEAGLPIVKVGEKAAKAPTKKPTHFDVGALYTRDEIAEHIQMPKERRGGNWDTGYDQFNGEYFLFCNVGNAGRTGHNYANRWCDGRLIWFGKSGTHLEQPQIQSLLSGQLPVHVFWRGKERAPFTYAGRGIAEGVRETTPVEVTWLFHTSQLATAEIVARPLWKRGPPPSIGERIIHKQDGPTSVYLMLLEGASSSTFPSLTDESKLVKIGMSNDPLRRLIELNSGIPPGCILQ